MFKGIHVSVKTPASWLRAPGDDALCFDFDGIRAVESFSRRVFEKS
jgi:hypothetical protein